MARLSAVPEMLSARKLHLVAGLKVYGLDLRKAELDFYMMRYAAVTGISLLITGMGLISLIKIEVPQYMRPTEEWFVWQVFSFPCLRCRDDVFSALQRSHHRLSGRECTGHGIARRIKLFGHLHRDPR